MGINILMLGGKRCGKTTVLSSMYDNINKVLAGTGMSVGVLDQVTHNTLLQAKNSIQGTMANFNVPLTRVEVDDNPTSAMKSYRFNLTLDGKIIPFTIHDIPGEWLTDPAQQATVRNLVAECQVILIAIDTPYLFAKMTGFGYGIYHQEYNKPLEITNFFKNSLSVNNLKDRMILFVPIKCERYYHLTHCPKLNVFQRNYMQELVSAVGAGYQDLLAYLRSTPELMNNCTLAVTPILSAGGIDFVKFYTDEETGKVVSLYQQPEFLKESEQGYSPRFCEQPMVYSLAYILMLEILQQQQKKGGSGQKIFGGSSGNQLFSAYETLRKKMLRNTGVHTEYGYYFIQNPRDL